MLLLNLFLYTLFLYLGFFVLYYLIFSLAGKLVNPKDIVNYERPPGRFAVLIPAYKEDGVIVDTVEKNLLQDYPADKWDIVVIADSLKEETINKLKAFPIITVVVNFVVSRKAKAINEALSQIGDYDYVIILDADNIMGKDFLLKMNERLQAGAVAVQGHRTAKNKDNSLAILDSVSEEINNHIFRYSQRVIGFSSALIGSGMGFKFDYYKQINTNVEDVWEDRELEFRILKNEDTIEYLHDALVYDEKVTDQTVFHNQRSKWMAGQIHYLKKYIFLNWNKIFTGNIDLLNKLLQTISPPRSILLGTLPVIIVISLIFNTSLSYTYWLVLSGCYFLALILAIPTSMLNRKLLKATLKLPLTILMMFLGFFRSVKSQDISYNTPHGNK
ncbi:glycosyltransferase family 2 protein [Flavitalea sp.]|nr:glycosyltransferase family 2 protein [Flavitalea sp.]